VLKKSKKKYGKLSLFERAAPVLNEFWPQAVILSSLVVLSSFFFPRGEALKYFYQLNDIPREPIIAPFTFPILKSEEKLKTDLKNFYPQIYFIINPIMQKRIIGNITQKK